MKDGEIARTTKELEDLLMANEKKQKSPMEELLAEMESAVARVEKRGTGGRRKDENGKRTPCGLENGSFRRFLFR